MNHRKILEIISELKKQLKDNSIIVADIKNIQYTNHHTTEIVLLAGKNLPKLND